jgi:nucleotide-binding universal stress UspA family protein
MEENDAEMLALVRHNVGFFDRIFHGSITKQMVLHPEHPMLILHDEIE